MDSGAHGFKTQVENEFIIKMGLQTHLRSKIHVKTSIGSSYLMKVVRKWALTKIQPPKGGDAHKKY